MGWCHEFGLHITARCDHPMVAGKESCTCDICGTTCQGKFEQDCVEVWDRGQRRLNLLAKPASDAPPLLLRDLSPAEPRQRRDDLAWRPDGWTSPDDAGDVAHEHDRAGADDGHTASVTEIVGLPAPAMDLSFREILPVREHEGLRPEKVLDAPPPPDDPIELEPPTPASAVAAPVSPSAAPPSPAQAVPEPAATEAQVASLTRAVEQLAATGALQQQGIAALQRELAGAAEAQRDALDVIRDALSASVAEQREALDVLRDALSASVAEQREAIDAVRQELAALAARPEPGPPEIPVDELGVAVREAMGATVVENRRISQQIEVAQRRVAELAETLPDRTGAAVAELMTTLVERVEAASGGVEAVGRLRHLLAELSAQMGQIQGEVTRLAMAHEALAAAADRDRS